jgi:hypothetical protein
MELVDAHSGEVNVEDVAPNDVERGYYYPRLVDHSKLRPLEVLTSFCPKIEMQLATTNGVEVLHDVGLLLFSPLTKLGISQEVQRLFVLPIIGSKKMKTFLVLWMKLRIWSFFCKRFQGFQVW